MLDLSQFHGTDSYYQFSPIFSNVVLTDGTKHLAEEAGAFWLMDVIASHIPAVRKTKDTFAVAALTKGKQGAKFTLTDDVPANVTYAKQKIEYTDFPLDEIKMYVSYDGFRWVILLPSEY